MIRFFSIPILVGIVFGIAFPYQAMSLVWVISILLFVLLFLNTVAIDKDKFVNLSANDWIECAVTMMLIFVLIPILQTALALVLVGDQDFAFGVVVCSLAPCALINPYFARYRGGKAPLALLNVVVSTLLCPLIIVPVLGLLGLSAIYLDPNFMFLYLGGLTALPVLMGIGINAVVPQSRHLVASSLGWCNSLILAVLIFILVGSAINRVPLRLLVTHDLYYVLILFLLFDFGLFFFAERAALMFMNRESAETLALSVATRNFAVTASLMLLFHPKAALPSAVGLIVHCAFFQFLLLKRKSGSDEKIL